MSNSVRKWLEMIGNADTTTLYEIQENLEYDYDICYDEMSFLLCELNKRMEAT